MLFVLQMEFFNLAFFYHLIYGAPLTASFVRFGSVWFSLVWLYHFFPCSWLCLRLVTCPDIVIAVPQPMAFLLAFQISIYLCVLPTFRKISAHFFPANVQITIEREQIVFFSCAVDSIKLNTFRVGIFATKCRLLPSFNTNQSIKYVIFACR